MRGRSNNLLCNFKEGRWRLWI